jgi:hypothetical protein
MVCLAVAQVLLRFDDGPAPGACSAATLDAAAASMIGVGIPQHRDAKGTHP